MDSQLAIIAVMYSSSTILNAIDFYSLFIQDIMADPRIKKHPYVLFILKMFPAQSTSVYP